MFKKVFLTLTLLLTLVTAFVAPLSQAHAAPFPSATDWTAIQAQAALIAQQAQEIATVAANIQTHAAQIQDPAVASLASGIVALASQTEQDATAIAITAEDINTRIDHSEATTLRLSDDIGTMADRIGEMADRILWTEGQIGVMADRIVESEYLISDSSLALAQMIQSETDLIASSGAATTHSVSLIQTLLP